NSPSSSAVEKSRDLFANKLLAIPFWLITLLILFSVGTDLFGVDRSGVSVVTSASTNGEEGETEVGESSVFMDSSSFLEKCLLKDGCRWEGLSSSASSIFGSVSTDESTGKEFAEIVISLWLNGSGSSASDSQTASQIQKSQT
ncbi:hypothetical protein Ccrd_014297, partial [Cynara cardunculus var. scolymus]